MTDAGAERLAQGIVKQACADWTKAMRRLKKAPDCDEADYIRRECERFFRSDFFFQLTGVSSKTFLDLLRRTL